MYTTLDIIYDPKTKIPTVDMPILRKLADDNGNIQIVDIIDAKTYTIGVFLAKHLIKNSLVLGLVHNYEAIYINLLCLCAGVEYYGKSKKEEFNMKMFVDDYDGMSKVLTQAFTELYYNDPNEAYRLRDLYIKRQGEIIKDYINEH